jgi:hypothetical protein
MVLEVEQIECCPRDKIAEWFWQTHQLKAVLLSSRSSLCQRVAVFTPKKDKQ